MALVSVVIPTLGRARVLARALASVLNQTMQDLELIVVVDGPDPETIDYLATVTDARVKLIQNAANTGAGPARDKGVAASSGRWIAFLDDDDEWLPTKLEKQLQALDGDSKSFATALSYVVTNNGTFIRPTHPYSGELPVDEWLFCRRSWLGAGNNLLQTSSFIVPRELAETLHFGKVRHEDWEYAIRAIKERGYRLITVREPLVVYYAGNSYPWAGSSEWVDSARDLLSPRAYSGFCLTVASQGVTSADRNQALRTFFWKAVRNGRPRAQDLLAFGLIWLVPDSSRHRLRALFARNRGHAPPAEPPLPISDR